jgi:SAM-dependent methyltransferase
MSLRQLKSTWENLGRVDPLWAVLSDPTRRHGRWDVDEFMATGRAQVDWIKELASDNDLSLGARAMDFGCGVGRLTNALAEHVTTSVGVDIAESMVAQARDMNRYPDRVSFVSYDGRTLPFEDGSFDSAVSLIVLQHARPAVQLGCLLELQRVVRQGGVLVLQIPSHPKLAEPLPPEAFLAGIEIIDAPATLAASASATLRVRVTNLSTHLWPVGRMVKLGNHWFDGDTMLVQDDGRTELPCDVDPGASVELALLVSAPPVSGRLQLEVDMLQEFVSWWKDAGSTPGRVDVAVRAVDGVPEAPTADRVDAVDVPAETASDDSQPSATADGADLGTAMEMHGLHTSLVRSLFTHCGSEVVAAVPDAMAGPEWESFTYVVRRVS